MFIWSGEFDAFRLPSPSLWRDILEKMRSNGFNAVVYTSYDYSAPFNEARQPTPKVGTMKELGYFVRSPGDRRQHQRS